MAVRISRGTSDAVLERIAAALEAYKADHPQAVIDLYRQNPASVRVRIIDPDFAGKGKSVRHQMAWQCLDRLDEDGQGDISTLVLITPDERARSFANIEFEDPVPAGL